MYYHICIYRSSFFAFKLRAKNILLHENFVMKQVITTFKAAVIGAARVKKRLHLVIIQTTNKKAFETVQSIIISLAN